MQPGRSEQGDYAAIAALESRIAHGEAMLADSQRMNQTYAAIIQDHERKLAGAASNIADLQRLNGGYASSLQEYEQRLANAQARLADAERVNAGYVQLIREHEQRAAGAGARLADAERMNAGYVQLIREHEQRAAGAEARLADAQQRSAAYVEVVGGLERRLAKTQERLDAHGQPLQRPLPLSQRQIAFMHVAKCAGMALSAYLRQMMAPCRVIDGLHALDRLDADYVRSMDLVLQHFSFEHTKKLRKDHFLFAVVREPVDRVVSFYANIRTRETGMEAEFPELVRACRSFSLAEFVKIDDPKLRVWISNHVARQFANDARVYDEGDAGELARLAIAHASVFDYIGLYEDFSNSLNILQYLLNWPLVDRLPQANVTIERPSVDTLDAGLVEKIRELNAADIALYEYAVDRHRQVLHGLRPFIDLRRNVLELRNR